MRGKWTPALAVAATVLAGATAALAARPKAGTWTGMTSQSLTIGTPALTFRVSAKGARIVNFEPTFEGTCTKPGSPAMTSPVITTDAGRNIPIKRGRFHATAKNGRIHSGAVTLATARDKLRGRFISRRKAKGSYSVTFKFNSNAAKFGLAGYTCRTGTVSWTATIG